MNVLDGILTELKAIQKRLHRLETIEARISKMYYSGTEYVTVSNGNVVINETGADVNFRVETDGNANMIVADGGLNAVGIGGAAEAGIALNVTGLFKVTDTTRLDADVIINENSADVDFRVESNGNANMLVVDGGFDAIGIGGAAVSGWELTVTGDSKVTGITALSNALERTISGGAITVTRSFHTVDTEGNAATDDLDTINGGAEGNVLVLCAEDSTRTVVVKDAGNLRLAGDMTLDNVSDSITLIYTASAVWRELSRSDNAA